jgi:glycosyltransferase involved in cell wall biosynthesis
MAQGVHRRAAEHENPEVTVVIPTRDRWGLLERRALRSALGQEDVRLEVVVVDDGSAEPAPTSIERDERVRLVRHETSRGVAAARNTGISEARAAWTAFLDDDDLWAPPKLRRQLDRLASEDASFVYSAVAHVDLAGDVLTIDAAPPAGELHDLLLAGHVIPGAASNVVVRTDLLREIGGYDGRLFILEDPDLALRLAQRARAASCDDVHVAYLQHEGARHLRDIDRLLTAYSYFRTKNPEVSAFLLENHLDWVLSQHRRAGRKVAAARLCWTVAKHERSPRWFVQGLTYLAGNRARHAVRRVKRVARGRRASHTVETGRRDDAAQRDLDWVKAYA